MPPSGQRCSRKRKDSGAGTVSYTHLEEGMRYRDIAVITGDLPGYGKEIAHQFEQNEIPYFMDDKKDVYKRQG